MPSSIFFNGRKQFRPGVYVKAEEILTADTGISGGNVALIGDFPIFKQDALNTFLDADSLLEFTQGGKTTSGTSMSDIAQVAFNPLIGATQTIDSLTLINIRPNSQASASNGGLTFKSKLWGAEGNSKKIKIFADSNDATKFQFSIKDGGLEVEKGTGVGFGEVATLSYDNAATLYTSMKVEITASLFNLAYTKSVAQGGANATSTVSWSKAHSGAVTFKTTSAIAAGGQTCVITGVDSTGVSTTETVTIATALNGLATSTKSWSNITSFAFTSTGGALVGGVEIQGKFKSVALNEIDDLETFLVGIVQEDDDFSAQAPSITLSGSDLDALTSTELKNAEVAFTANTQAMFDALSASMYIEAVKSSNAVITVDADYVSLVGGGQSSIAGSNWNTALEAILYKAIQIIVPWTDDVTVHEKVKNHCKDAAEISGLHRNAWVGAAKEKTLAEIKSSWVNVLNDKNIAIVGQGISFQRTNAAGNILTINKADPQWLALMLACMQGCTAIAEPLTNKKPNIVSTSEVFNPLKEASQAIQSGIVILTNAGGLGNRVERSVTTHVKDNNFVYSEVSANESLNTCLRDVKFSLQEEIGSKALASAANDVSTIVTNRLITQRNLSIIRDFRKVTAVAVGDYINVSFELAVVEPLNFIIVNAKFGRF